MIETKQPITSINGFNIGDTVRLKDGDGREHTIKSFSIEGLNEFFFEVQFEDGSWTMLDNIELLPFNLDEAAEEFGKRQGIELAPFAKKFFKSGVKWMTEQGKTVEGYIVDEISHNGVAVILDNEEQFKPGDRVIVQIRKK